MSSRKIVYLMRGLPSSGKSHMARKLAGDNGLVCETDTYFHAHVGEDPERYDYQAELLDKAKQWNFEQFRKAIADGVTPIVVDRGNSLALETRHYASHAIEHGYEVTLKEPDSEWWQEIRVLLKYKRHTWPILLQWAEVLATLNSRSHRVPVGVIERRMAKWRTALTVQEILDLDPDKQPEPVRKRVEHIPGNNGSAESAVSVTVPQHAHLVIAGAANNATNTPEQRVDRRILLFDDSAGTFESPEAEARSPEMEAAGSPLNPCAGPSPTMNDWIFDGSEGEADGDGEWNPGGLVEWGSMPSVSR